MQKPTQALQLVKGPGNTFDIIAKWSRTLPSLIYLPWDIYRDPLHRKKIKYQSWYLTSCCGLEVLKPTQALQSVKGPGNIFDWNPKRARTLPSLIYFSWDIHRDPLINKQKSNIKVNIWNPAVGLWCRNPPRHFSRLKAREIPLNDTPSGQELCRL